MVTMEDIATIAGISQPAVSAALNGNSKVRVSAATREKVLKIAKELNYVPNVAAQMLAGGDTNTVGILATPTGGLQGDLLNQIFTILTEKNYKVLLTAYSWPTFSSASAISEIIARGIKGIIILDWNSEDKIKAFSEYPIVKIGNDKEHSDVSVDLYAAGLLATSHLLNHGHKKVHLVRVNSNVDNERTSGWQQAHKNLGIEISSDDIIDLRNIGGLASNLLNELKTKQVTALFCHNDYIALKVMQVCLENNIRVPEDIAIIGCDGRSFTQSSPIGISTIITPVRPVAQAAVDLLLKKIASPKEKFTEKKLIQPLLFPSGSCGCKNKKVEQLYTVNTMETIETDYRINFKTELFNQNNE